MKNTWNGYQIEGFLGSGGIGKVYQAWEGSRRVALKFLNSGTEASVLRFFREEVRLLSQLSHPNLVRIYDFFDVGSPIHFFSKDGALPEDFPQGVPFFAMEYLSGASLDHLGAKTSEELWIQIFEQICQGLHYLHARNILHRDLKPSNLFFTAEGSVKILDFSISTEQSRSAPSAATLGTLPYMPPEAFMGEFTAQSDLFSLGVSFFQLLTSKLPYDKPLTQRGFQELKSQKALQTLRPDLPEYFSDLIQRMIDLSPLKRPASAATLLKYLAQHSAHPQKSCEEPSEEDILEKIPFVGRDKEMLVFLQATQAEARDRGPKILLVHGPTGIGRSRLIEEAKWHYLLRQTSFLVIPPEVAGHWLSWICAKLKGEGSFETIQDFFALQKKSLEILQDRHHILVLTDLQGWPDRSIQELKIWLNTLIRSKIQLSLVLEYNDESMVRDLSLEELAISVQDLALQDLNEQATRDLIEKASVDFPIPSQLIGTIVQASGGRPLLALEAIKNYAQGDRKAASFQAPKNFAEVCRLRIQKLKPDSRFLLGLILTHSKSPTLTELHELTVAKDLNFEEALLQLDQMRFIQGRSPDLPTCELAHPSLKSTYLEALDGKLRIQCHQAWVACLKKQAVSSDAESDTPLLLLEHALGAQDLDSQVEWGMKAMQLLHDHGRFEKALEISERLLDISDPRFNRCDLLAYRAPIFYRLGKFSESLQAYQDWAVLKEDDVGRKQRAKFLFYSGLVQFTAGNIQAAKNFFKDCLDTSNSQTYPALRPYHARSYNLLAILLEKEGRLEEARSLFERALPLSEGDPLLLGEIEQGLGSLEIRALRYDEAQAHYLRALKHSQALQNPQVEAMARQSLALLFKVTGDLRNAAQEMERALELSLKGGEILQWARYRGNQGLIFQDLGRYGKALEAILESTEILNVMGTEEERWISELHLTRLYGSLGNRQKAQGLLRHLEKHQAQLKEKGLAHSLFFLKAEDAFFAGDYRQAAELYREGFVLSPQDSHLEERFDYLRSLARFEILDPENPALLDFLKLIEKLPGSSFAAWKSFFSFFCKNIEDASEAEVEALLQEISSLEKPELRLDLWSLIALKLGWNDFETLYEYFKGLAEEEWLTLYQSLEEELKMDFEKNRSLRNLEQSLKETPAKRAEEAASTASLPPPNPGNKAQISEDRFRQFCQISRQISQKTDLGEILERVMDAAIDLSGAERGFLILKNEKARDEKLPGYEVKTARHLNQQALKAGDFQFSFSIVQEAISQGVPLITDNAQSDERFAQAKSIHQYQLKSILVAPLELEGEVLGAIYLDHRYQPDCFTKEDIVMLSGFASQAVLAIQKVKMMEELRKSKEGLEIKVKDQAQHIEVLSEELSQTKSNLRYEYSEIIGRSPPMMRVFQLLDHVTHTKIPVWICGESGTGKELIARSLHVNSQRKNGPYITENCSAIPETLLESELFGHKKGSFTHADKDRVGLFEQAHGGTLFLDEVADMSMGMQVKLLRVLQEGEVRPVGSSKVIKIDVRLVTASNRDLAQLVKEGKFRQDLFYRINGMTIRLPPLRERREDIPLLVHFLIKKIAKEFELKPSQVSKEGFQVLMQHPWPGNIRELEGVIRNMLLFSNGQTITKEFFALHQDLLNNPEDMSSLVGGSGYAPPVQELDEAKSEERRQLIESFRKHHMDKKQVADELGISLKSVYARMERYGVPKKKEALERFLMDN